MLAHTMQKSSAVEKCMEQCMAARDAACRCAGLHGVYRKELQRRRNGTRRERTAFTAVKVPPLAYNPP